jgi:glutamate synthase (NADPH/NADH) small chain
VDVRLPSEPGASCHIVNLHGRPVDLDQVVTLDELRGLSAVRDWAPATVRAVPTPHDLFMPRLVSEEEALQVITGQRPGLQLALSTRGQYGAVAENHRASPFIPPNHLAMVSHAGGLHHDEVSLLVEVPAPEAVDTLAWRLRSIAQKLIAMGVSAGAKCMVSVTKGELLLDPCHRIRDHNGRDFKPMQMYRLSDVRGFRDVEDLPSLKRPPQERIFDAEPVVSGEYTLEQALQEAARCVECGLCRDICPNGVGLASYVEKLKQGELESAASDLRELNPGVDLTCLVCPAPCQSLCILAHEEIPRRPVYIRGIEQVLAQQPVPPEVRAPAATGFKVALIGLGPANVVAAARLAKKGHEVHVFERQTEFGGAVALIPSFRVRHAKAQDWVEQLLQETGVVIHTGITFGKNLEFESLRAQFNAVILGIGAGKPMTLGIEGEEYGGVIDALQVLRKFNKEAAGEPSDEPPPRLRNTIVIGGGDVAADVVMWYVRTAARCARQVAEAARDGAAQTPEVANVVWAYRRGRAEMPVSQEVLADAEDEINALREYQLGAGIVPAEGELASGVYFHLRPLKVLGEQGKVCGMQFIKTRYRGERDRSGRRIVEDIPGSEFTIPADAVVVLAVGQRPDPAALKNLPGVKFDDQGKVRVDESMKAADGIYAVGDLVGGEMLADAISHGRRAADAIHQDYLAGLARSR